MTTIERTGRSVVKHAKRYHISVKAEVLHPFQQVISGQDQDRVSVYLTIFHHNVDFYPWSQQ